MYEVVSLRHSNVFEKSYGTLSIPTYLLLVKKSQLYEFVPITTIIEISNFLTRVFYHL